MRTFLNFAANKMREHAATAETMAKSRPDSPLYQATASMTKMWAAVVEAEAAMLALNAVMGTEPPPAPPGVGTGPQDNT